MEHFPTGLAVAAARSRAPWLLPRLRKELPLLAGLVFGLAVMALFGFFASRERGVGVNDFSYFWAGGHTVLDGADPYDGVSFAAESGQFGTAPPHESVFAYPPWVALALVPLAALPLWVASGLFTYGGMLLAALGLRAVLRVFASGLPAVHTLAGAALFASQPGLAALQAGQWAFLLTGALAWMVVALRERSPLRHLASLALLLKPQLVLFDVWALVRAALARRGSRYAAIVVGLFATAVAIPWLLFPDWLAAYGRAFVAQRLDYVPPTTPAQALLDLVGAPGAWLGAGALLVAVAAGLLFDPRSDAWFAVWIAVSASFPVYAWSYDQVVLVVPVAIAAGVVARRRARAGLVVGVAGYAFLLLGPALLYEIANRRESESFSAFVPLAVLALVVAALWPERRRPLLESTE